MTDWRDDPFFQVPLADAATSEGVVSLPILYYDCSHFIALFWVEHSVAQSCAGRDGLEAVRFRNGKALAIVAFFEYRHAAIAAYNEVGVAVVAVPPGTALPRARLLSLLRHPERNRVGFNILDLPVTTPAACAAGRELWGYPKFVTPIEFSLAGHEFRGAVQDPDAPGDLVTLAGRTGVGVPAPLLDLVLYSRHQGRTLRTAVITRGGGRCCLPGSIRLRVTGSTHRMAGNLRALGLDGARPAFVTHTHGLQLRLNAGAVIG